MRKLKKNPIPNNEKMEVKDYSRLFGGVFNRIEEYGGDVSSPMYSRATKMLDAFLVNLDKSVLEKEVVDWIDSDALDSLISDNPFPRLCSGGHLELAKWYNWRVSYQEYQLPRREALLQACKNGHVNVVEWLGESTSLRAENDRPFLLACVGEHTDLIEWFQRRYQDLPDFRPLVREAKGSGIKDSHISEFFEILGSDAKEFLTIPKGSPEEPGRTQVYIAFQEMKEKDEEKREQDKKLKADFLAISIEVEEKSLMEQHGLEMSPEIRERFLALREYFETHDEGFLQKLNEYCEYIRRLAEPPTKTRKEVEKGCCVMM